MTHDAIAIAMLEQVKESKVQKFQMDGELLYFDEPLYVPKSGNLRREVVKECCYSLWASHRGNTKRGLWWSEVTIGSGSDKM